MTSAEVTILGIFEDKAQEDFHRGLITRAAGELGLLVALDSRLTSGCRFDYLREHLEDALGYSGVVVGVDARRRSLDEKVGLLEQGARDAGLTGLPRLILWSAASPSIEEWIMADAEALPAVLREVLGSPVHRVPRPGRAAAERTAKARLQEWSLQLVGSPLLRGGREYAEQVALRTEAGRIGASRNPDLRDLLERRLPQFLGECATAGAGS